MIKTIAIRVVVFTIISILFFNIFGLFAPVITNDLALGQMENDNAAYLEWEAWNRTQNIVSIGYTILVIAFAAWNLMTVYNYIKIKENM